MTPYTPYMYTCLSFSLTSKVHFSQMDEKTGIRLQNSTIWEMFYYYENLIKVAV